MFLMLYNKLIFSLQETPYIIRLAGVFFLQNFIQLKKKKALKEQKQKEILHP